MTQQEQMLDIIKSLLYSDIDDDSQFKDNFQTREQKNRDREISKLLQKYVATYENKVTTQNKYRHIIFWFFLILTGVLSIIFCGLVIFFGIKIDSIDVPGVVSLISVGITFLTALISLLQIVTKYCFPEKDEEYITKIVESIQSNDLEHKLANIKLRQQDSEVLKAQKPNSGADQNGK